MDRTLNSVGLIPTMYTVRRISGARSEIEDAAPVPRPLGRCQLGPVSPPDGIVYFHKTSERDDARDESLGDDAMASIFLSHSSQDNEVAADLSRRLKEHGYDSLFLDFDPDSGIKAGRDWERELYRNLKLARAVIVLCSPSSMASRWCFVEIAQAKALGKAIFPITISPVPGRKHPERPPGDRPDRPRGGRGLSTALRQPPRRGARSRGQFPLGPETAPFSRSQLLRRQGRRHLLRPRGRGAPGDRDADTDAAPRGAASAGGGRLFGQRQIVAGPRRRLAEAAARIGRNGLSSTRSAPGRSRSASWPDRYPWHFQRARADPTGRRSAIASETSPRAASSGEGSAALADSVLDRVRGRPDHASRPPRSVCAPRGGSEPRNCSRALPATKPRPSSTCSGAPRSGRGGRVFGLLTLRSDFLGSFQNHPALRGLAFADLPLGLLPVENFPQVIEGPADRAEIALEPGLVHSMIADARTDDALPLLAFTLREMYERCRDQQRLTLKVYRDDLGGIKGAVARVVERIKAEGAWTPEVGRALRRAFLKLVRVNDEGQFTRQPCRWADLPDLAAPVLEAFVKARLLSSNGDVVEVTHESLFRVWPELAGWLDEGRELMLWKKNLQDEVKAWIAHDRSPPYLLSGARVAEGRRWLASNADDFPGPEAEFITASIAAEDERIAREHTQQEKLRWLARCLAVAAVAASLIGVYAFSQRNEANAKAKAALRG